MKEKGLINLLIKRKITQKKKKQIKKYRNIVFITQTDRKLNEFNSVNDFM